MFLEWCQRCGALQLGKVIQHTSGNATCTLHEMKKVIPVNLERMFPKMKEQKFEKVQVQQYEAPSNNNGGLGGYTTGEVCGLCGTEMVRQGSCGVCLNCGNTSGCS